MFAGLIVQSEAAVWFSGLLPWAGWVLSTLGSQATGRKWKKIFPHIYSMSWVYFLQWAAG